MLDTPDRRQVHSAREDRTDDFDRLANRIIEVETALIEVKEAMIT